MALSKSQLEILDEVKRVVIETRSSDRVIGTIIWVVVDDGDVFVRSVRGDGGKWYQRALADPEVALRAGDDRLSLRAVPAADAESVERVSEALRRKYNPGGSLDSMLLPEVLGTTLRLDPV
ncbi:MAG TPA: DUF2255 family protein [Acidimicrobiia bacterium]|nr:DUF2255 family protein [Acidimicrobiia bacterium]